MEYKVIVTGITSCNQDYQAVQALRKLYGCTGCPGVPDDREFAQYWILAWNTGVTLDGALWHTHKDTSMSAHRITYEELMKRFHRYKSVRKELTV